jgi:4-hydroxybenzoyl-CoA thioesterase
MPFRTRAQVRFGDVDHAGIVYYPRFFIYFHEAFEDFFNAADEPLLRYAHLIDVRRIGFPTVHIETDYKAPLRYGDSLDIQLSVPKIGKHSAIFRYEGFRAPDGEPACVAQITSVAVNLDTFKSVEFPADVLTLLQKFAK